MTTDTELRDLLTHEATGLARHPAGWDDVVRRGHHHRRITRLRNGLAMGTVAALVAVAGLSIADGPGDDRQGVVSGDPDPTTAPTTPDAPVSPNNLGSSARVQGVFVTVLTAPADPGAGTDPCEDWRPRVIENPDQVVVELVYHSLADSEPWAGCQASAFSGHGLIELTDPLGDRRLVDGWDGAEISVIDGAPLLFPTSLPEPFDLEHWDELGAAPEQWTFSWSEDDVVLSVTSGGPPGSCVGDPVDVRGTTGTLCGNDVEDTAGYLLHWEEAGMARHVELTHVGAEPLGFAPEHVLEVAAGLEPLGTTSANPRE